MTLARHKNGSKIALFFGAGVILLLITLGVALTWFCVQYGLNVAQKNRGKPFVHRRPSIAELEKWYPSAFFKSESDLKICDAISAGDSEQLGSLLNSKVELSRPGKFGMTLLMWAYAQDNMDAFKLLLRHGADPDLKVNKTFSWSPQGPVEIENEIPGFTPFVVGDTVLFASFHHMRSNYCIEGVKFAHVEKQLDRNGKNLLHRFLLTPDVGDKEVLVALIDAGVDLNAKDYDGNTPCQRAVFDHPDYCLLLLQAGADPSIRDDKGRDLVDLVERRLGAGGRQNGRDYDPLINWLRENYREINSHRP